MFFTQMPINVTIFFIISGLAQLFWVIPVIKRWSKPWYYIGIGGTSILIVVLPDIGDILAYRHGLHFWQEVNPYRNQNKV